MEDDLKKNKKMEDDLKKRKMEDNLNFLFEKLGPNEHWSSLPPLRITQNLFTIVQNVSIDSVHK